MIMRKGKAKRTLVYIFIIIGPTRMEKLGNGEITCGLTVKRKIIDSDRRRYKGHMT